MNCRIRIRQLKSNLYVIDEIVTLDGLFITWPGSYRSREAAREAIRNEAKLCIK